MFNIELCKDNLKEIMVVKKTKELLMQHCCYGWTWVNFIHTLRNKPKKDNWNYFVDQFHELLKVVHRN